MTLANRVSKRCQPAQAAHQHQEAHTAAEETCLVHYMRRATLSGCPLSRKDVFQVANELRKNRCSLDEPNSLDAAHVPLLGHTWFDKFKKRHPQLQSAAQRGLERSRFKAESPASLEPYFSELGELLNANKYDPSLMFNMDETGYGIGASQSTRVIAVRSEENPPIKSKQNKVKKVTTARQEWVTTVECISADGNVLPPLVIFKGTTDILQSWIPREHGLVDGWRWAVSHKGWTNSTLALDWLTRVFEPCTVRKAAGKRRLLMVDGHGRCAGLLNGLYLPI